MGFINLYEFESIYREGRIEKSPTIGVVEIGDQINMPPEAILCSVKDGKKVDDLGSCWAGDIERLLNIAAAEGDTDQRNPNLPVLRRLFADMSMFKEVRLKEKAALENPQPAKILPFPDKKQPRP